MEKQYRSYYAVIPANVRYDKRLNANAKLLYGEITALCNERGYCWATNEYFGSLYGVAKQTISKWIALLEECGYVKRHLEYKPGTKEIANRYIHICDTPINEKVNTPINEKINTCKPKGCEGVNEKVNTPINEKVKENNTLFNNTFNNTNKRGLAAAQTYFDDENLNKVFLDFMEMRKSIKNGKMTNRAITMMVSKLKRYSVADAIQMLEKSILNNWKDVYEINTSSSNHGKGESTNEQPRSNESSASENNSVYLNLYDELYGPGTE